MAEFTPTDRRLHPQTLAWLMLSGFTVFFCVIAALGSYAASQFYTSATLTREALVRVHVRSGVGYQPRGSGTLSTPTNQCSELPDICIDRMREGERLKAFRNAGYGPVATLVIPDADPPSQVDLWSLPYGADLTLERYRVSRWNSRQQEVVVRQDAGYARYDLRGGAGYERASYTVLLGGTIQVQLDTDGSYSINVPRNDDGVLVRARTAVPTATLTLAEIAVRSGSALISSGSKTLVVRPGNLVRIDAKGVIGVPEEAAWNVLADGAFTRYTSDQYNQPSGTETWSINSSPGAADMNADERNGLFTTFRACPPEKVDFCDQTDRVTVAQFRRDGGQTRTFITGITQTLDVDVSEFRSVVLSGWVRVLNQGVPLAGSQGSECPIMFEISYKETSPADATQSFRRCVYSVDEPGADVGMARSPEISYTPVAPYAWNRLRIDLRNEPQLRSVRYLQRIRIEARGHDYMAEFTDLSLVGRQN